MGGGAEDFVEGVGEENRFSIVWDGLLVTLLQGKYDAYSRVGLFLFLFFSFLFFLLLSLPSLTPSPFFPQHSKGQLASFISHGKA